MNPLRRAEFAQKEFVGLGADSYFKMVFSGTLVPAVQQ
jgi:hypothetical protein